MLRRGQLTRDVHTAVHRGIASTPKYLFGQTPSCSPSCFTTSRHFRQQQKARDKLHPRDGRTNWSSFSADTLHPASWARGDARNVKTWRWPLLHHVAARLTVTAGHTAFCPHSASPTSQQPLRNVDHQVCNAKYFPRFYQEIEGARTSFDKLLPEHADCRVVV